MSLSAVRAGLKATLILSGVETYGYMTLRPNTPAVVVGFPEELDPRAVLGPGMDYVIDVALFVSLSDDRVADENLTALVEDVLVILDANPTLGNSVSSCVATRVGDFGRMPLGDTEEALGCLVTVEVYG